MSAEQSVTKPKSIRKEVKGDVKEKEGGGTKKKTVQLKRPESKEKGKLALILIRGLVGIRKDIKATLYTLRLRKKHACVVLEDTPANRAAAMKCKDYITYGEINEDVLKQLIERRGKKNPKEKDSFKKFFLLHPPRGGFERKGIKTPFKKGGALGYRGTKINDLIKKMI